MRERLARVVGLRTEDVFADSNYLRARPYPLACGGSGIKVVQRSAGRIPAVHSVLRRAGAFVVGSQIYLSVGYAGKSSRLVNNSGNTIGKLGAGDTVENYRCDRNLTGIAFAARFAVYATGQQIQIAVGYIARFGRSRTGCRAAAESDTHCLSRGVTYYTVRFKPVLTLKILYRRLGFGSVNAVHAAGVVSPTFKLGLNIFNYRSARTDLDNRGVGYAYADGYRYNGG